MISRYSRPEMSALWSDQGRFAIWLEIELRVLEELERRGMVPTGTAAAVRLNAKVDITRINELEAQTKHDVISFVSQVAESCGPAGGYLHRGMTSSDLVDSAFALQLTRSADLLLNGVDSLRNVVANRAQEFRTTACIGRTHGIHAEPTTFGVKLAGWYAELSRARTRLVHAKAEIAVGKIAGAVGTYQGLPPEVELAVLTSLGLRPETVATQVVQRDRHAAFFSTLALVATSIERMAVEIRHLQRTEVREAQEYFSPGQKGSSAMPHKRNPILTENLCGLARVIRGYATTALENVALWHERDISHSSAERIIAPDGCIALDFMLHRFRGVVEQLVVYPERMAANIQLTRGLVFSGAVLTALVDSGVERDTAYRMTQAHAQAAWEGGATFEERVRADAALCAKVSAQQLAEAFDLSRQLAHTGMIIDRALGATGGE